MFNEFEDKANRTALLIASEKYYKQLKPFVTSKARLSYVETDIERIVKEATKVTGADYNYVLSTLKQRLAEEVGNEPRGDGNLDQIADIIKDQGGVHDDPKNWGGVPGLGLEEAIRPDGLTNFDLKDQTQDWGTEDSEKGDGLPKWETFPNTPFEDTKVENANPVVSCFRCDQPLNPVYAAVTPVCKSCTQKLAVGEGLSDDMSNSGLQRTEHDDPVDSHNKDHLDEHLFQCKICNKEGNLVKGTHDELVHHITEQHADVLNRKDMDKQYDERAKRINPGLPEEKPSMEYESALRSAMTRQDFRGIAGVLKQQNASPSLVYSFADYLSTTNPLFNRDTFIGAATNNTPSVSDQMFGEAGGAPQQQAPIPQQQDQSQAQPPMQQQARTADFLDVPRGNNDIAEVEPNSSQPAERFDDIVQDLADRAAAQQFSAASDEEVNKIAQSYNADVNGIKNSLFGTATFGRYTGVNGQVGESPTIPNGYSEVSTDGLGGKVGSHEALVPTDAVIHKVSQEMGMEPNLVYSMVRDRYGDDLPDKYHASVSGEHHFYLPADLVGPQQPTPPPDQSQAQPQAPAPMPVDPSQQQQAPNPMSLNGLQ